LRPPLRPPLFPYTTLFRSDAVLHGREIGDVVALVAKAQQTGEAEAIAEHGVIDAVRVGDADESKARAAGAKSAAIGEKVAAEVGDRKSTRLNSSHVAISYA